jgi:uncharacterized protein (TIGR02246 family)
MKHAYAGCWVLLVACLAPGPAATRAAEPSDRKADREAIEQASRSFAAAFNAGDAKAVAEAWTENGEYYDDSGVILRGRDAIEKAYAALFKERPKGRIDFVVQSLRFPSRDSAIEEGIARVTSQGAELPTSSRYTAIHVREDGVWKIAVAREWGGAEDRLDDLAWLVGDWAANSKDRDVRLSFAWNEPKTFLTCRFRVSEGGKPASSGTQEIGRDPRTGRICSWMFNDDGGRGQAVWIRDGDRWVMESTGVTPAGVDTSATNILTRIDDRSFSWRSVNRRVGGAAAPDTAPVTLSRVAPGK